MNLILLSAADFVSAHRVVLTDRRRDHILSVHRADQGDRLRVGLIDGALGSGLVISADPARVELEVQLDQQPPAPLPVTLLLALPRPKMLKRILQTVTAMGVKQLYLLNSYRVDKSFWSSPFLQPEKITEQLLLGLEQARDSILPEVHLRPRFKPFVEDELPALSRHTTKLVAHPGGAHPCPRELLAPTTLAVGPEGGFIDYEIARLEECGFTPVTLGSRILRVETAVPVLLSRLSP